MKYYILGSLLREKEMEDLKIFFGKHSCVVRCVEKDDNTLIMN